MELLDTEIYGNSLQEWGLALILGVATLVALRLFARVVLRRLAGLAARTTTTWDGLLTTVLNTTRPVLVGLLAIYVGSLSLDLSDRVRGIIESVTVIALLIQGGLWASATLTTWLTQYRARELAKDRATVTTLTGIGFVGKVVIWAAVVLLALDNLGVNITALVAGLGVGGIAVALAVQNILGDLFASLSIVLDKPFVIGDFLVIDQYAGSVEHIGLKTTRVRSLSGEQLVFANSDLLKSRLRNYGRMFERRILFKIGVTYQTAQEKLEWIPGKIREIVEAQEKARFDRSHFMEYGDSSLNVETVYFVQSPEYNVYMDTHQAILLAIREAFEQQAIEFAYPTRTLFVEQAGVDERPVAEAGRSEPKRRR
jgi:small-conductance mechanosensitive channel